ncbi:cytochrome P450 monooxygenase-like protein [Glonium stellatum]|uniref:Cytochrome P450 monooxygenase-like protein n=1 Tax=Glonium stellatum TaxID=574774 RepID=A0A8E2EX03_9PEZI|nr:cytochrome P450 monooxygenase-like protein [Glonium stellatum]
MFFLQSDSFTVPKLCLYICVAYLLFGILRVTYYITFHPVAQIPGPRLRAAFFFPFFWEIWTGDVVHNWHELHEKYGDIVRISPTYISVTSAEAWRDIYGQSATKKPIPKDPDAYVQSLDGVAEIISSNDADHTRIRRLLNHAFSDQALRQQESIINSFIDVLIQKLHQKATLGSPVDMVRWLNFTTFDIIGDLCFSESFDALKNEDYHFWIANIFRGLKFSRIFRVLRGYPIIGYPLLGLFQLFPALAKAREKHRQYTEDKTARRLDKKSEQQDFMSYILRHNDEKGMTRPEIMKTSGTIIVAGSETSATLLSGAVFYLLQNPTWMQKLQLEIRTGFRDESEMTFAVLSQLKCLNAIIQETFRLYPPVPTTLPRRTTKEGAIVNGIFIPAGVSVGVAQYPAYHSSRNFTDPEQFAPERFLGHPKYQDDHRGVIQPFSIGPRNCIGQSLAWAEIRAILARLIWHFDMELEDSSSAWNKQKVFILWDKPALMVKLKSRS